jgi:hypothetical protein
LGKPRGIVRAAVAVMVTALLVAASGTSSEARVIRPGGKGVPAAGAMFGTTLSVGSSLTLHKLESKVGRKFAIVQRYYGWTQKFPNIDQRRDIARGRIPMIGWRSASLISIIHGKYDWLIRLRARKLKALRHLVFMRWGWEMNGNWEPWSLHPSKFKRAWRHVHRIFVRQGALNVAWVWAPNWEDVPKVSWNHWTNYYPGDRYVDWVGIDGFNWGATQPWSHWTTIDRIVRRLYHAYHRRKPMMVAETASVEQGGSKARWILHAGSALHWNYPAIAALIYYNGRDRNEPVHWSVTTSSRALRAFRTVGHEAYWALR